MQKAIVTTTINPPTKALLKFLEIAKRDDWHIFIVGDKKTPHEAYANLMAPTQNQSIITYLHPDEQEARHKELSDLIGWNCIQRRNFGLLAAYEWGAHIIATVDDDNIPYENWGKDVYVGEQRQVPLYDTAGAVFNPLARHDFGYQLVNMCNDPETAYIQSIWHRGVPVQQVGGHQSHDPKIAIGRKVLTQVLVQADMWDGDPDVDAITRIVLHPEVKFKHYEPYTGVKAGPFNSQNTFIWHEVLRDYFLFPHIGRMDDIWASYVMQRLHPNSVIYGPATVYQDRNEHDLSKDLQAEMLGYRHSSELIAWLQDHDPVNDEWPEFMPREALQAWRIWRALLA